MEQHQIQQPPLKTKLKNNFFIGLKSFKFVWNNKKLLLFPIIATCSFFLILIPLAYTNYPTTLLTLSNWEKITPETSEKEISEEKKNQTKNEKFSYQLKAEKKEAGHKEMWQLGALAILLFMVALLIFNFTNISLAYATNQAFLGLPITISSSLLHSLKRLPTILLWLCISMVAGLFVTSVTGDQTRSRLNPLNFIRSIIGATLAFAWKVATFLVIPVLALEDVGAFKAISRSTQLIKQKFGDNIGAILVLPLLRVVIISLLYFIASLIVVGAIPYYVLFYTKQTPSEIFLFSTLIGVIIMIIIILFIALSIVLSAITVFKTASYNYAIGKPVGPFSDTDITSNFEHTTPHLPDNNL